MLVLILDGKNTLKQLAAESFILQDSRQCRLYGLYLRFSQFTTPWLLTTSADKIDKTNVIAKKRLKQIIEYKF